jgi:hypothetical protein
MMNSLMACDTVLSGRQKPMLRRNLFRVTLKIKATVSSQTLTNGVPLQKTLLLKFGSYLIENTPRLNYVNVLRLGHVFSYPTLVTALLPPCLHCAYTTVRNIQTIILNENKNRIKNNKKGEEKSLGWRILSILTSHSSNSAYKCCNRIFFLRHKVPSRSVRQVFVLFPMLWFSSF